MPILKSANILDGFVRRGTLPSPTGCNVIISNVDMNSSVHVDNEKKDILILGEDLTQRLDNAKHTAEKKYSFNFTVTKNKFCLSLDCNEVSSYLFVYGTEIIKFKAKDSEIVATP